MVHIKTSLRIIQTFSFLPKNDLSDTLKSRDSDHFSAFVKFNFLVVANFTKCSLRANLQWSRFFFFRFTKISYNCGKLHYSCTRFGWRFTDFLFFFVLMFAATTVWFWLILYLKMLFEICTKCCNFCNECKGVTVYRLIFIILH